jgi:hypothetical protein
VVSEEDLIANAPAHVQDFLNAKQTRIDSLHDYYVQAWRNLRMAMGDYGTEHRQAFINTLEKQLEQEFYPSTNPHSQESFDQFMDAFDAFFNPPHVYYVPAIGGFDEMHESSFASDDSSESESEGSDNSDGSGPVANGDLEQQQRERYDEFWRRAGFVPENSDLLEWLEKRSGLPSIKHLNRSAVRDPFALAQCRPCFNTKELFL